MGVVPASGSSYGAWELVAEASARQRRSLEDEARGRRHQARVGREQSARSRDSFRAADGLQSAETGGSRDAAHRVSNSGVTDGDLAHPSSKGQAGEQSG